MIRVAITGGIAEGKSTVLHLLERWGAHGVSSDDLVRELVRPGMDLWEQIVARFGKDIVKPDGTLYRERLATLTFGDTEARRALNRLVHPAVVAALKERYVACQKGNGQGAVSSGGQARVFAVEVPLLVEVALQGWFHQILVVCATPRLQRQRLRIRGLPSEMIEALLASQLPTRAKMPFADWIVRTDRPLARVEKQVAKIWTLLSETSYVYAIEEPMGNA